VAGFREVDSVVASWWLVEVSSVVASGGWLR
jgi:hypothetical protein